MKERHQGRGGLSAFGDAHPNNCVEQFEYRLMPLVSESVDLAIHEVSRARKLVAKVKTNQVKRAVDLDALKSMAYAWFNSHRSAISKADSSLDCSAVDTTYQTILNCTAKFAAKTTYLDALREVKSALLALRSEALSPARAPITSSTDDLAPDLSPLAGNQEMRDILTRRWHECRRCVGAEAHLAAIVMMGGLLEALFVARANKMSDKAPLVNGKRSVEPYPPRRSARRGRIRVGKRPRAAGVARRRRGVRAPSSSGAKVRSGPARCSHVPGRWTGPWDAGRAHHRLSD
jgi:hypothetical protein